MTKELTLSDIYRYIALSFRYPEVDWFNDDFLKTFFEISQKAGFSIEVEGSNQIFKKDNWLEVAQVEYTRLFVTASAGVVASPYGSVYVDGNGLLYDRFTEKIAKFYLEKGFELRDEQHPPDYIIYQLEFMAMLEHNDPAGLEEFISDCFRPWFEPFMKIIYAETTHPYFILTTKLADFFTSQEE